MPKNERKTESNVNNSIILFHNISWFIYNGESNKLEESWEEEIKGFINNGYNQGQFEIFDKNNNTDYLIWNIL
jgi:hypothetical protein